MVLLNFFLFIAYCRLLALVDAAVSSVAPPGSLPSGSAPSESQPSGSAPSGSPSSGSAPSASSSNSPTLTASYVINGSNVINSSSTTIKETSVNKSVILVTNRGSLTISNFTIVKLSGDTTSADDSSFYGLNSGVVASNGGKINISNSVIQTSSEGSNAIVSTGSQSIVYIDNIIINTTKDVSRGLHGTLTGTIIADKVKITTTGAHCAALASDRGGATLLITRATINTSGSGSPGIYSTGNITASNIQSVASGSEGAVIEGRNNITLTDSTITGSVRCGVFLYQSYSGDAETGTAEFTMTRGSITALAGPLFFTTNTASQIQLSAVELIGSTSRILLSAGADQWGTTGSNGGQVQFKVTNQTLVGDVICDSISTIEITLETKSSFTGAINSNNTAKSISLTLDASSTWNVTGTSYLTTITNADTTLINIDDNGNIVYYLSTVSGNTYLNGKTYSLKNGGKLIPYGNDNNIVVTTTTVGNSAASTVSGYTGKLRYWLWWCLKQITNDGPKPISYLSRRLKPAEKRYSTTEKECLAMVRCIKEFRPYLLGPEFTVETDHCPLCNFHRKSSKNGQIDRWSIGLGEYDIGK
ncbi:unnamed protein product [Didymodactylos carnosus]|uniref:Reverse transcriptase RNase H-like domain-containing protein n=1 Tax=Didymodactylos carnosus TaxID=1234261 RepID=A0A813YET5_9BILA|nr:unnamed protein product [Didymodactylos carnosus]CAF0883369.1 unnamed protein product [Didymodactylos carnosus]CAF3550008.1 unnamed protein product [Didymodactylos carnosus]CAF3669110.1 unnamed protein product [Didymodactylos carnosus]